jgi:uncharacterized protein
VVTKFPRVRRWLEQLLHTHDTPARTAAAYAVGVFFGFSPLLGLHTVLGLLVGFALNLNRVAVLLGVYSNLPWVLVPYYSLATWVGAGILGIDVPLAPVAGLVGSLENRSWGDFLAAIRNLRPVLTAFTLGSTLGASLLALVAYRAALVTILTHRKHQSRSHDTHS